MGIFGLTKGGTELIDDRKEGQDRTFDVLSTDFTKRGAIRSAKRRVHPTIPFRDAETVNVTLDRDLGVRKRYIVTISHNEDKY